MQNEKLKKKMGFYLKAKHGLNLKMDLRPNWSQFGRGNRGEGKRRREGEKKKKRKRKRKEGDQASQDQEVWNYMVLYGFLV